MEKHGLYIHGARWRYRQQSPHFTAEVTVREDMYSGLLTTGGNLLIGRETSLPARRVEAPLQHEVGTHLLTYYNGSAQPLRLLKVGLAGYDGLQEGLAVLCEYLVGGLACVGWVRADKVGHVDTSSGLG